MPKLYWEGKYVGDIAANDEQGVDGYIRCLDKIQEVEPMAQRPCYHDAIVVYRRKWFFGLIGPKVYVVRCWLCNYCSKGFSTKEEANLHRRKLEDRHYNG